MVLTPRAGPFNLDFSARVQHPMRLVLQGLNGHGGVLAQLEVTLVRGPHARLGPKMVLPITVCCKVD